MAAAGVGGAGLVEGGTVPVAGANGFAITALTDASLDPADLAESLIGDDGDIEIVPGSVSFTGDDRAGGEFSGGTGIIDIEDGIVLSSGEVEDVVGPNEEPWTTTELEEDGDADLEGLIDPVEPDEECLHGDVDDTEEVVPEDTFDATILEFEFTVPEGATDVFFDYVFGSEEYNQWVGSPFNDVFALWVNDVNAALVPDPDNPGDPLPAAINNVNHGWTGALPDSVDPDNFHDPEIKKLSGAWGCEYDPVNEDLFVNNDPHTGHEVKHDPLAADADAPYDTEMDGFTVPLLAEAGVDPAGTNTMRLAIADTGDPLLDSWVFIESGSLRVVAVSIGIDGPIEAQCGREKEYDVRVQNDGAEPRENVEIEYELTRPGGIEAGDVLLEWFDDDAGEWKDLPLSDDNGSLSGTFAPDGPFSLPTGFDETQEIRATFDVAGEFTATAEVVGVDEGIVYGSTSHTVTVTCPDVSMDVEGPMEAQCGREKDYAVRVSNEGDEPIEDVAVEYELARPGGIEAGDVSLEWFDGDAGEWKDLPLSDDNGSLSGTFPPDGPFSLPMGFDETQEIRATFAVAGAFTATAEVVGVDTGIVYADTQHTVSVTCPDIAIGIDGPDEVPCGVEEEYDVRVQNDGDEPIEDVAVEYELVRTGGIEAEDVLLEWFDGDAGEWNELPLSDDNGSLSGRFPPDDGGFSTPEGFDETRTVRARFEGITETYTVSAEVVGVDHDIVYADTEHTVVVLEPPEQCVDLIAGQHIGAGEVCVGNDTDDLDVTYATAGEWTLTETHLAVGDDLDEYEDEGWVNRRGNPRPGRFPYSDDHGRTDEVTYTIPLDGLDAESKDDLVIAAHAVVEREDDEIQEETAWGDGPRFVQRGNWAMYFEYEVCR